MNLSVVIPTLNAASRLPATLAALADADEIVIADSGSNDGTVTLAAACGARVVAAPSGRGPQLIAGARAACNAWLLFLHADTVLEPGWRNEVDRFMALPEHAKVAATFRFALDDDSPFARQLEAVVARRSRWFGLAYGDQGLLIHRDFYAGLGGFRPWPLMEDVDFVRRIGRGRLLVFRTAARTSAERWRRDGWRRRSARNLGCLALYFAGVPPHIIQRLYG
ncbi:MAG: TIGR04283 family arsenosugar biosynthesis glycosyltransferase [Alphaproteobacteria bacterium]|nr:TIGR04283 family arsenosugar biosynthesis glycosyltransferase [Alphaproteobacteria bacterium]